MTTGREPPVGTIVVAYDEHESGERALLRASQLAEALHSRLVVLSIAPPIEPSPSVEELEPSFGATPISAARIAVDPTAITPGPEEPRPSFARADEHAARARDLVARSKVAEVEIVEARRPDPVDELVELAEAKGADLVVVGAHAPSIWERLFGETRDQEVSRRVGRDVLIVH